MTPDTLQFQCGFCRTTLTVPAQMAGVSGPCPSCGQTVTSPAAMQTAQWPQAPAVPQPPPAWPASPPAGLASSLGIPAAASTGLPPKRLPGQTPLSTTLGGSAGGQAPWNSSPPPSPGMLDMHSTGSGGLPNHSRLIPGAPALPGMTLGGPSGIPGMMTAPGTSLLGREVPPAPISPMTQPLQANGLPTLSLGGRPGHEGASTSPIPPGRSISSLRAPRGTNFIRLAFAALFMLGFLGLVGFLLKDYLPGVFPGLTSQDPEEIITESAPPMPDPAKLADANTRQSAPLPAVVSKADKTPLQQTKPASLGFDPTEPVAGAKPQPSVPPEITTATAASTPKTEVAVSMTQTAPLPKTSATTPNTLLEVSPKTSADGMPATTPPTAAPDTSTQSNTIAEDDAPPEAKPAVEALRKFLAATSLSERLQHTLGAEHMRPLMERYYTRLADGPVIVDRIQFVRMDPNPELGSGKHCIFSLENKTWEFPVPVMLEEQPDGFKVDWLAFVEFKDRLLEKFFQSYQEGAARFHVGIIRHHYFEDGVPNIERKDAFRVMPAPPNSFQASVFLDKDSALAQELRTRLPWETHVWAVVELEWKKLGSQQWVELSAVPQMHWYSLPAAPRPISTTQKVPEKEELPPGITKNGARSKSGGSSGSGSNMPPPGIQKSSPGLPPTIKRPLPAGR